MANKAFARIESMTGSPADLYNNISVVFSYAVMADDGTYINDRGGNQQVIAYTDDTVSISANVAETVRVLESDPGLIVEIIL